MSAIGPQLYAASFVIDLINAFGVPVIIGGLLGTGGLGALVPAIIAWRKAPVERKDADIAAADAAQGMTLALAEALRVDLDRMGTRLKAVEDKLANETSRREQLEEVVRDQRDVNYRLRVVLSRVQDAWDHIVLHWHDVRLREEPPHFPVLNIDD